MIQCQYCAGHEWFRYNRSAARLMTCCDGRGLRVRRYCSGSPDSFTKRNVRMVEAMSTGIETSTRRITNTNMMC